METLTDSEGFVLDRISDGRPVEPLATRLGFFDDMSDDLILWFFETVDCS